MSGETRSGESEVQQRVTVSRMRRADPWLAIGLVGVLALLVAALYGDRLAPHEDIFSLLEGPAGEPRPFAPGGLFPLGSDTAGRDLLSLILIGARTTLAIVVVAGIARVAAGLALSLVASWWAKPRYALDALAEVASAIPATLVAVLAILALFASDPHPAGFIGALLVTGWAGPYRVFRAELERLGGAPFTDGALTLGVGRGALFARHHLPHLVPIVALQSSQHIAAALVALAELGVLSIFVGPTRFLNLTESLRVVRQGGFLVVRLSEIPEWGGLLANARGIENLYTTRWVFLVPGLAFAVTAVAFGALGIGIARQFRRRNLLDDLASPRTALVAVGVAALVAGSFLVPPRYAAASDWSRAARDSVSADADLEQAFAAAGLQPLGASYAIEGTTTRLRQVAPSQLEIRGARAGTRLREGLGAAGDYQPVLYDAAGGGMLDVPVVFAGWGIAPSDIAELQVGAFSPPDLGRAVKDWADDYAAVDVRGKAVLILRLQSVLTGPRATQGPDFQSTVANALKRGAAAVLYVDPLRKTYPTVTRVGGRVNPYLRLAEVAPLENASRPPVFALDVAAADRFLEGSRPTATEIYARLSETSGGVRASDASTRISLARPLPVTAHIELPIALVRSTSRTLAANTPAPPGTPRIVVWAVAPDPDDRSRAAADAIAAAARAVGSHPGPAVTLVAFDPSADVTADARAVRQLMAGAPIDLVLVVQSMLGGKLQFQTAYGDLVPVIDRYAELAGARYRITRVASPIDLVQWPGIAAFPTTRSVVIRGDGAVGDVRADAAAVIGQAIGRWVLGAPELHP